MNIPKVGPLKFQPIFKYRIWGGERLKTSLKKDYVEDQIGESWEISNIEGDKTKVITGALAGKTLTEIIKIYKAEFLGKHVYEAFGEEFPLLIKFLDAQKPLSIQVHPNDELAKQRHNSFGKNEMWYILEADEGAEIIVGFNTELDKDTYIKNLQHGTLLEVLNKTSVKAGDTFNIPTGRVHAIGAGVLLAEIQQTSDITYRIYDYNRVDAKTGEKRELHTQESIDAIDFTVKDSYKVAYSLKQNDSSKLVHTPYFKSNIVELKGRFEKRYSALDSFVIIICVAGKFNLTYNAENYLLRYGETLLLPASLEGVTFNGTAKFLEVYL